MSVVQKNRSSKDREVEKFQENYHRNKEHYIQPTIHIDKFTRQEYVNPEYVKRYGNPYNPDNPESIYLGKSEKEVAQEILTKEKRQKIIDDTLYDTQVLMLYDNHEDLSESALVCKLCSAYNNKNNILCFHCSEPMFLSRNYGQ